MKRLNGWQRTGVVFSLLWILGILSYAVYDNFTVIKYNAELMERCDPLSREVEREKNPFMDILCDHPSQSRLTISVILYISLLPVAGAWLLVYLVILVVAWIKDGFKT